MTLSLLVLLNKHLTLLHSVPFFTDVVEESLTLSSSSSTLEAVVVDALLVVVDSRGGRSLSGLSTLSSSLLTLEAVDSRGSRCLACRRSPRRC